MVKKKKQNKKTRWSTAEKNLEKVKFGRKER